MCSAALGLYGAEIDRGASLHLQITSCMPGVDLTTDHSGPVTHAQAQQLLQLVTADEAELQGLPPAAVEAAQVLASRRNGRLHAHGLPRAMLQIDAKDSGAAELDMPPREAAASRSGTVQWRHEDPDAHDPLQAVLAAEAGVSRVQRSEASWLEADSPHNRPTTDGGSAQHQQAKSLSALPQSVTAEAHERGHGPAGVHPAQAVQRMWLEAEDSRPTHWPMDDLPAAAPEVIELAHEWQEPLPGSPRGAESEASWESSQWTDSGSETSSSAWSELSADELAGVRHEVFISASRPSALAATSSRQPGREINSRPGVHVGDAGQVSDSITAPSLPLTRASLLQMQQSLGSSPGKGSGKRLSPGSLRVEAVSERGLSSDEEDTHSSRLLPPGLLVARLPPMAASLTPLASKLPPATSAQSPVPESLHVAGPSRDSYSSAATVDPAAGPARLPLRPLPRAGVSSQASEAPPPRRSRCRHMLCSSSTTLTSVLGVCRIAPANQDGGTLDTARTSMLLFQVRWATRSSSALARRAVCRRRSSADLPPVL